MCEEIVKCKRCNRVLTNEKSIKLGYGRICYIKIQLLQEQNNNDGHKNILERIRKLELDNNFMKHQLKHKTIVSNSKDSMLDWDIPQEVKEVRNEYKIQFNVVIKELKIILNSNESILEKDFRFNNEDLGIKTEEEIIELLN